MRANVICNVILLGIVVVILAFSENLYRRIVCKVGLLFTGRMGSICVTFKCIGQECIGEFNACYDEVEYIIDVFEIEKLNRRLCLGPY